MSVIAPVVRTAVRRVLPAFALAFLVLPVAHAARGGARPGHPDPGEDGGRFRAEPADTAGTSADTASARKEEGPWLVAAAHGPADTLRFTTDQGTWMNLDVSPDGSTVVFDLLGDLYLLPIGGGKATRVTSGLPYDQQPRFSPDGSRILFTSDRGGGDNLWTVRKDGGDPRPVTADKEHVINSGAWSPDGEMVIGRKRLTDQSSIGTVELWLYYVLGGKGIQVTKKAEIPDANEPTFSPDGRWIYFSARGARYQYNRNVYAGIWQIRAYDRVTGNVRPLTDGYGGSGRPTVSPDGRTIAFIRRDRTKTLLMLHDLATGREHILFDGLNPDMQENFAWTGTYPTFAWTPNGREIVVWFGGGIHRVDATTGTERAVPFTADVEQHVTRALRFPQDIAPDSVRVRMLSWISQSPRGDGVVFSALGGIYRMSLPHGTPAPLTAKGPRSYAPSFSPDGGSIAYVTWSDADGGQVWVMDARGRGSRRLSDVPGQYANPVFSRDGKNVAYLKGSGATGRGHDLGDELWFEIWWVPAGGGSPRYVVTTGNRGSSRRMPRISWSPDGTRLFYCEDIEGDSELKTALVSVRLDGTDRREHLRIKHGEEMVVSPDGKWVAYTHDFEGFVTALPELGKEPVEMSGEEGPLPTYRFTQDGADWVTWTADGSALTWGRGPGFYRLRLADIRAAWTAKKDEAGAKTDPATAAARDKEKDKKNLGVAHPDTVDVALSVPRARPRGTYAVRGARLITMRGDEVIPSGTVVVENDRIAAIGPDGETPIPAGAKVFDGSGKTVIPGLIDVHAHLHYDALDIIPENIPPYYANLAYGVTTVHDPSASTYAVFTQSEMVQAGVTVGPRVFSTGFILYGADIPNAAPIEDLDGARRAVRRLKAMGAFTVKSYMQPRRDQRQWVIEAAREESMMVVPEGGGNLEMNLSMVLDGHTGIEHALPVAPIYNDVVTLFSRSQSGYTPTLLVAYGGLSGEHWFYQHSEVWKNAKLLRFTPRGELDARARRRPVMAPDDDWHHMAVAAGCKKIVEAGGKVQLGAHGQRQGLGADWELWALTQGGMTNAEALRCATLFGAQYLGLDGWIGSLEKGKLADFVVLDGDPLQDIHNTEKVHAVVKNGEMFDGESMDRIWPSPRPRPVFFWEAQGEMLRPHVDED